MGAQPGDSLHALSVVWAGRTAAVGDSTALVYACGIMLVPESTRDQNMLDTRVSEEIHRMSLLERRAVGSI